jgi:hypothetical protein
LFAESSNDTDVNSFNNPTEFYDRLLSNLSNYFMSTADFEEIYGNKSKFGVVILFAETLLDAAMDQIGQNEMRAYLCLKPQQIDFAARIEESPNEEANLTAGFYDNLNYFQALICEYNFDERSLNKFQPDEIKIAADFLNKKFPEIRQFFELKYRYEMDVDGPKALSKSIIDRLFNIFVKARARLNSAAHKMLRTSIDAHNLRKNKPKCFNF